MDGGNLIKINKNGSTRETFKRIHIGSGSAYDEKWLQEKIYEDISLLSASDPNYDHMQLVPLCREFAMHDGTRNVFLDILAISETGKLILVECKLWKNPQARREVLAQIIEYASLLQSLSYADFSVRLKKYIKSGTEDPLCYRFKELGLDFDESTLIDRVSNSLKLGRFQLIIAGDGIRTDIINIINSPTMSGVMSDICLLDVGLFENETGDICLLPSVPVKTETIQKTVLVSTEGMPVVLEDEIEENGITQNPRVSNQVQKEANSLFYSNLVKAVIFEHPEQEKLRKGGNNWARSPLPEPFKWMTLYRAKNPFRIGIFAVCDTATCIQVYEFLHSNLNVLKTEISEEVGLELIDKTWRNTGQNTNDIDLYLRHEVDWTVLSTNDEQVKWFEEYANKFVNCLRLLANSYVELK